MTNSNSNGERLNQREFKGYVTAKLEDFDNRLDIMSEQLKVIEQRTNWLIFKVGSISATVAFLVSLFISNIKWP